MADVTPSDGTASVVEVEFRLEDERYPFTGVTDAENCTFELAEMIPRSDGRYAEFFNVTGSDAARIAAIASEHDHADVTLLSEYEHGGLFEFLVSGDCPAHSLAELGALPRDVEGVDGEGRIVAEIPEQYDPSSVIAEFLEQYPDAELMTKRELDAASPLLTETAVQEVLYTHLTDRQREILEAAFEAGYYDWPRECTGTDVAAELGITSATFSEHIHAAERNLLSAIFDVSSPTGPDAS